MVITSEISVKKILKEDIGKYVGFAFEGDNELVEKFHFADTTLEETVSSNVKNIIELSEKIDLLLNDKNLYNKFASNARNRSFDFSKVEIPYKELN